MESALCENESASRSVISADFLLPGRYAYRIDGIREGKNKIIEGAFNDIEKSTKRF